ncbi:glycoside hydrolase family 15 protein [Kineococcus sp. SYSU DK002]|uniref:glycoside hydrolase family 15 protein n=1 Tax=Kineococcus sp. SYSU DK002 TaxID=3383123 RepID=UPI003D7C8F00
MPDTPDPSRRDRDGYVDLRSYAAIGDGRTVALVAQDGGIDWLPLPDLDSLPVFARLLDGAGGGHLALTPAGPWTVQRAYVEGTNVLRSTYTTPTGTVRVTDSMNMGSTGRLPWGELCRLVEGLSGEVEMTWCVAPGSGLGAYAPWAEETRNGAVLRLDAVTLAVRTVDVGDTTFQDREVSGRFRTSEGSEHLLALLSSQGEPLRMPSTRWIRRNVDQTILRWRSWSEQFTYEGRWREEALRAALLLKLLAHEPSGAVAAAATTSLPESPGGGKNWDYRMAWLRDATYSLHCLIALGEFEDVHANVSWLLRVARRSQPDLPVLSRLDGHQPDGLVRHDVPGWRGQGPVVSGNEAAGQLQLGVYGDVFDLVHQYVLDGNVLDVETARFLAGVADRTCDLWQRRDSGMWELPELQHYTSSKMACWQALECAVQLADNGHIPGSVDRWRREAGRVRAWVEENCWSAERGAYVWYPGTTDLDASVLLHAASGFDTGPRMSATIDAVRAELSDGPLVHRYSGAAAEEKAFAACSFWLAAALGAVGRREEGVDQLERTLALGNDVGVWAEMVDPADGSSWGNLPQALSHLSLMAAVLTLGRDG